MLGQEYMLQSQSFITRMRESLSMITETEQYKQYTTRYQNLIKVIMMMMLTKMMLMFDPDQGGQH